MRRVYWIVLCLVLSCLFASVSAGRRPVPPEEGGFAPITARLEFAHAVVEEPGPTQFGYVRSDGSFVPLADADTGITSASPSWQ
jgi:hypothetical protein